MHQNPARPNPAIAAFHQHPVASNVVPSISFDTQNLNIGSELIMHHQSSTRPNPVFTVFQQHSVASNVVQSTSFDTQYRNMESELNMHQTPTRPNPAFAPF